MCDWNEEEYAEYLLWVEAAKVRARVLAPKEPRSARSELALPVSLPPEPVEA